MSIHGSSAYADTQPGKSKTVADILTAAAEMIAGEGRWVQHTYGRDAAMGGWSCLCLYGAVCEAAYDGQHDSPLNVENEPLLFVEQVIGTDRVAAWNDAPERTQAEVVAALRAAAEKARTASAVGTSSASEPNTPAVSS